jgi:hypothetical protein
MDREQRGCRTKQVYMSRADARRIERVMSRRYREAFRAYACPWCGNYHLGHTVPASIRAQQAIPARLVPAFERPAVRIA